MERTEMIRELYASINEDNRLIRSRHICKKGVR